MNKINLKITHSGNFSVDSSWGGTVVSPTDSKLYFITDGEFYIISPNGEKTVLTKRNSYLVPSGYSYSFGCNASMSHIFFHLTLTAFDGIDLLGNVKHPISLPFDNIPTGVLNYSDLVSSLNTESFVCASLFALLTSNGINIGANTYSEEVKKAIEYIRKNLSIQLSLKEIAENAFAAPSTLTRNFRRETGMSIGEYIDLQIFGEAEKLLKFTRLSIREIGEKFGFCDQFYFSRKFSEKYGTSPCKYRRFNVDI